MARAKRFDRDRATARRRYRATLAGSPAAPEATGDGDGSAEGAEAAAAVSQRGQRPATSARGSRPGQQRMGMIAAARAAYRRVEVRGDLRGLPGLVVHRAFWIPVLLSLASVVLLVVLGEGNQIAAFAFSVFTVPPAMASVFVAGFFAPTAGWLIGGLVGTLASVFFSGYAIAVASGLVPGADAALASEKLADSIQTAFLIGPVYGIVLGAAAAWYKRFLYLSSPGRPSDSRGAGAKGRSRSGSSRQGSRGR